MYLYIVIFLSLLHGLCLIYFSEARKVVKPVYRDHHGQDQRMVSKGRWSLLTGTAYPIREISTASNKIAMFDDVNMLSGFLESLNRRKTVFTDGSDCTTKECRNSQERQKRSATSDSSNAQTKQKDDGQSNAKQKDDGQSNAKHKETLISKITPYAFGNPSLPDKSKKGNKRPKPKKPRG